MFTISCVLTDADKPVSHKIPRQLVDLMEEYVMPNTAFLTFESKLQEYRKTLLHVKCTTHIRPGILTTEILHHVIADDNSRTFACLAPSAGAADWLTLMVTLSGKVPGMSLKDPSSNSNRYSENFLDGSYLKELGIRSIASIPGSLATPRLRSFYGFMFSRNPYERLLSVYRRMFVDEDPYRAEVIYKSQYAERIINGFRTETSVRAMHGDIGVTFPEFVAYITSFNNTEDLLDECKPLVEICDACTVPYQFIGQLETLQTDLPYLIYDGFKINVTFDINVTNFRMFDDATVAKYYEEVPDSLIKAVKVTYDKDFSVFGYSTTVPGHPEVVNKHSA